MRQQRAGAFKSSDAWFSLRRRARALQVGNSSAYATCPPRVCRMEQSHGEDLTRQWGRPARVIEKVASIGSVLAIIIVFHNFVSAYLCFFGTQCTPDAQQITTYRVLAVVTLLIVLVAIGAAVYNRRRWLFVWHGLVAVTAVAALVLFAVPHIRWNDPLPQVNNFENGEQCYTGGTGFCQGG